jgi:hypothetical protein
LALGVQAEVQTPGALAAAAVQLAPGLLAQVDFLVAAAPILRMLAAILLLAALVVLVAAVEQELEILLQRVTPQAAQVATVTQSSSCCEANHDLQHP